MEIVDPVIIAIDENYACDWREGSNNGHQGQINSISRKDIIIHEGCCHIELRMQRIKVHIIRNKCQIKKALRLDRLNHGG